MKRLFLVLVALAVVAVVAAAAPAADRPHASLVITTDQTTITLPAGQTTTQFLVTGVLDDAWGNHVGHEVTLATYENTTCSGVPHETRTLLSAKDTGAFQQIAYGTIEVGSFQAVAEISHHEYVESNCLVVTVQQAPVIPPVVPPTTPTTPDVQLPKPDPGSYLCWNREMTDPVAYPDSVADEMWLTGRYLEPAAILGNVPDGTNIGAYHLVCNIPTGLKQSDEALGGSGEVYDANVTALYHATHADGNDLNVYHIWK